MCENVSPNVKLICNEDTEFAVALKMVRKLLQNLDKFINILLRFVLIYVKCNE